MTPPAKAFEFFAAGTVFGTGLVPLLDWVSRFPDTGSVPYLGLLAIVVSFVLVTANMAAKQ